MSDSERLILPINSSDIITPLQHFREGLAEIFAEQDEARYDQTDFPRKSIVHAKLSRIEPKVHLPGSVLDIWTWIPTPETTPYDPNDEFIIITSSFTKVIGDPGDDLKITHERNFRLGYKRVGEEVAINYTGEDNLLRAQRRPGEAYKSGNHSQKVQDVRTQSELGQRLRWAIGLVDRIVNPKE